MHGRDQFCISNMHSLMRSILIKKRIQYSHENQPHEKPHFYLTKFPKVISSSHNFQPCNQPQTMLKQAPKMPLRGSTRPGSRLLAISRRGLGLARRRDTLGAGRGRRRVGLIDAADLLQGGRDVGGQRGRGAAGRSAARGRAAWLGARGRSAGWGSARGRRGKVAGGVGALLILGGAGLGGRGS